MVKILITGSKARIFEKCAFQLTKLIPSKAYTMVPKHSGIFSHSPIRARPEIEGKFCTLQMVISPNEANTDKFANVDSGAMYLSSRISDVIQNIGRTMVMNDDTSMCSP